MQFYCLLLGSSILFLVFIFNLLIFNSCFQSTGMSSLNMQSAKAYDIGFKLKIAICNYVQTLL